MSQDERVASRRAALTVLVATALVTAGVALLLWTSGRPAIYIDDGVLAFRLLDGLGYSLAFHGPAGPTAAYSPLVPLLLAGLHGALGDGRAALVAVVALQGLIHLATALLTYVVARFWLSPWPAAVAGLLVGLHPGLLRLSLDRGHLDERYGLAMLLMLVALWSLLRVFRAPSHARFAIAGAAFALAALSDATMTVVAGLAFLVMLAPKNRSRWGLRGPLAFATVAALVAAPWLVRNAIVFGTFVPMRNSGGLLLWVGNNPHASGTWSDQEIMADPDRRSTPRGSFQLGGHATTFNFYARDTLPPDVREQLAVVDEVRRDRLLLRAALQWMVENPVHFAKLTARRAFYLIAGPPAADDRRWPRLLLLSTFLAAFAVAASGRYPGLGWASVFLGVWWLAFAVTHCGYLDYRLVMEPFVMLSCCTGVHGAFEAWRGSGA